MKTKVLFFSAWWCKGCLDMRQPFYDEARKNGLKYDIVDVDTEDGAELSCKYDIKSVPTLLFLKGDRIVGKEKGNESYKRMRKYV